MKAKIYYLPEQERQYLPGEKIKGPHTGPEEAKYENQTKRRYSPAPIYRLHPKKD